MVDIEEIKNFLKKLQEAVERADFSLWTGKAFVRKDKVDDIMCCIIALLPKPYKLKLPKERQKYEHYSSVSSYYELSRLIKKQFFLFPNYYFIEKMRIRELIIRILRNIETDIHKIENL